MKRTPLSRYSEERIAQMQAEAPIRVALCERAGGIPQTRVVQVYRNNQRYTYTKVECLGGKCECGLPDCGQYPRYWESLEPHEKLPRGKGGVLSMSNTIMVLRTCHHKLQNNLPIWSKP